MKIGYSEKQIRIVEMKCDGWTDKDIKKELVIADSFFNKLLSDIRMKASLPRQTITWKARKDDVLFNLKKYIECADKCDEAKREFYESKVDFDF